MSSKDPIRDADSAKFALSADMDPRIYFAAERTLLAWMRTGLAVIGIGFLVARFGLFLNMLRSSASDVQTPIVSSLIGIGFILLGSFMIAVAAWQHLQFCRMLQVQQRPARYIMSFGIAISVLLSILGMVLAIYLLSSAYLGA